VRIACISTSLVPSITANSIQVMKACQAMTQLGHQVHLWVPGKDAFPFESMKQQYGLENNFEVSWLPSRRSFKRYDFTISSLRAVNRWNSDLIYTWLPQAAWGGLAFTKRPVVLEMHDRTSGMFGLFWLKQFIKSTDKKELVVVSRALKKALEVQAGQVIPENEVVIAPNGVDLQRYQDLPDPGAARRGLKLPEKITVGYTGHFYAGRGVEILFKLAAAYPDIQFLWIGGREKELEDVRRRLNNEQLWNVVLTGFVDNSQISLYQAACEILLMPYEKAIAGSSGGNSVDICSPMKMFEYMAAGRAIISSDLPVIHEVLNNQSAMFCPPEDAALWIAAVGRLINDPTLREAQGNNARMRISDYSIINRQEKILKFMAGSD
jgi:glycosyltransferase involved in cell wall biosynthesis